LIFVGCYSFVLSFIVEVMIVCVSSALSV